MIFKCACEKPPFNYLDYKTTNLGEDNNGAEVSIDHCKKCGSNWVKYLIEEPHYSNSGRWWRAISSEPALSADIAKEYIQSREWCFIGGSFHNSTGKKVYAPITIT
ncbi:hypothetical protein KO528_01330 [Saccharophagus degradans]|uniref:hypothetical protein n=1 Tax=Saccharophagus degradans TaxID=86304 RepID=UPI001C0A3A97|nr:hypothetical protein [Saccharophagus degradans]MBU2983979.1 hypothetical protein [Saccharophagus degradans]WGO96665.1 hypothetical protein QFX18_11470 [Saccharophagus degradans]